MKVLQEALLISRLRLRDVLANETKEFQRRFIVQDLAERSLQTIKRSLSVSLHRDFKFKENIGNVLCKNSRVINVNSLEIEQRNHQNVHLVQNKSFDTHN